MNIQLDAIAHVIQLSVAPVFLLTGIGAILGVLANRIGRVVDRARVLESQLSAASKDAAAQLHAELESLSSRARLIYRAISLSVLAALLICAVIVTLFGSAFWASDLTRVAAVLFAAALIALIAGLLTFLREIYLATVTLRIGPH
jgi:hypothetical protein